MTRQTGIIAALVAVLAILLFYFFVWSPKSDEIDETEAQIQTVEQQQAQLRQRITELKEIRNNAPELEAAIVAAESVVPRDIGQAAAIRQLQLAADESGVDLPSVTFSRPAQIEDAPPGLAAIDLNLQALGGYYQLVDFYRRVEDPTITPRGFVWNSLQLAPEEYPTLTAASAGTMYALLPAPPEPEPDPTDSPTPGADGDEPTTPAEDEEATS